MTQFLKSLIKVSEKAANIARVCRQDKHLFKYLVQEKGEDEKNPKFVHDFKTLADVLIQETIKHDIGKQFPAIASYIKGEESNSFSNTLGDTICVVVKEDEASTAALLSKVLNGDTTAAELLAAEVHRTVCVEGDILSSVKLPDDLELPLSHLGMWIDPIDSTLEYIEGDQVAPTLRNIHSKGLQCVTVLIGVFDRRNGEPVLGVINQPFHAFHNSEWRGQFFWGLSFESINKVFAPSCTATESTENKVVLLSSNESPTLKQTLRDAGFSVVEAAGAGYKCLSVALGQADVYLLSRGTTFRWDTCAPHALLRAQQGGIVEFMPCKGGELKSLSYLESEFLPDSPKQDIKVWCNQQGIIAYRDIQLLKDIIEVLKRC